MANFGSVGKTTTYTFSLWHVLNYLVDKSEVTYKEFEKNTGIPPGHGIELEIQELIESRHKLIEMPIKLHSGVKPGRTMLCYSITEKGRQFMKTLPPDKLETIVCADLPHFARGIEWLANEELQRMAEESAEKKVP